MCGICCIFTSSVIGGFCFEDHVKKNSRLCRRGPDSSCAKTIVLSDKLSAMLSGHVLHLRGDDIVPQPTTHSSGNLLLWNGEIYDGIKVCESECDTEILLNLLSSNTTDQLILSTMAQIEGPWSFIFWQASTETLWFGRDVFGRRSLLWHLPDLHNNEFILSSVQIAPWAYTEVPSVGIFKMSRNTFVDISDQSKCKYKVTLFPWERAFWPGTLEPVCGDKEFSEKIRCGQLADRVEFDLCNEEEVRSKMPILNKEILPVYLSLPAVPDDQLHSDYLMQLLEKNSLLRTLSRQLSQVLLEAIRTRVFNQPKLHLNTKECSKGQKFSCPVRESANTMTNLPVSNDTNDIGNVTQTLDNVTLASQSETGNKAAFTTSVRVDHFSDKQAIEETSALYKKEFDEHTLHVGSANGASCDNHMTSTSRVAILFSGGIDSTVIAALADKCVPQDEPIDLLNVAFEMKPKTCNSKKKRPPDLPTIKKWDVPDRLTGYTALWELNPNRKWNFIEVNVTAEQLQEARTLHIKELLYPLQTVLDDSIGCAVWFAARGRGILGNGPNKGAAIQSVSKVILCGMGADEQLVGYSRHRSTFKEAGLAGLIDEIELEVTRISARNLGRDDRIITDHGKESRFPFLDEKVVHFLSSLPLYHKADLTLPRGLGEKLLLRLSAMELGLLQTATLPKRAIQFGSRIAKMENTKEKASDKCTRLVDQIVQMTE